MGLTKSNYYQKPEVRIDYSFDDGHKLDLRVAEVLNRYDVKAVFYIVLDWIGKDRFLTWDDIKELDKQGHKIGSHTMSHPNDLKLIYEEQLHYEIQNSKDLLETALGHTISSFSYPRGRADERVKRKVIESGYVEARGTGKPGVTKIEDKFYLPGTIHIFQRDEYGGKPIFDYAKEVIDKVKIEGGYINIFGHSKEIQENDDWDVLEQVLKYVSGGTNNRN